MAVDVYDLSGTKRDWSWLEGKFGPKLLRPSQYTYAYRVVRIDERRGHASFIVKLIDENGAPVSGITVIRNWVGMGPEHQLPTWVEPPERWFERGVHGETNNNGDIGYGMGPGDLYYPPATGASSVWGGHKEGDQKWGSDCLSGLGWIVHPIDGDLHLDVVLQRTVGEPPPPEPDENWQMLFETLATTNALMVDVNSRLGNLNNKATTIIKRLDTIISLLPKQ